MAIAGPLPAARTIPIIYLDLLSIKSRAHAHYEIEREVRDTEPELRLEARQQRSRPILDALHLWLEEQRRRVPDGSAIARALDYSLKRWAALVRYVEDPAVPIDNNHIEGQIRTVALGRSNWLFAGSLRAGQRAAAIMGLIQSALCRRRHSAEDFLFSDRGPQMHESSRRDRSASGK